MKAIARSFVWWPNLDKDIEEKIKLCTPCQAVRNSPPVAPLHPWNWPTRPWSRIHLDFCTTEGKDFLVVIDSHSKWLEVFAMSSTTAERTIDELRLLFASYGMPEQVVTDNGPQFISSDFKNFLRSNGIKPTLTTPYHAPSNGAAERFVQIVICAFEKQVTGDTQLSLKHWIANVFLRYHTTPHIVTG